MKKIMLIILLLGLSRLAEAGLSDQWETALFGHMEAVVETDTHGVSHSEFLATPLQIGRMNNEYLVGVDGGVLGDIQPQAGQGGLQWTAGVHLHLSPLLRKYIFTNLSPNYPAFNAIEINPRYSYDFTRHQSEVGIGLGWSFSLTPLP